MSYVNASTIYVWAYVDGYGTLQICLLFSKLLKVSVFLGLKEVFGLVCAFHMF